MLGTESGHYALEKAEVVLLLGTDFPYTAWYPKKARIAQIELNTWVGDPNSTSDSWETSVRQDHNPGRLAAAEKQKKRQASENLPRKNAVKQKNRWAALRKAKKSESRSIRSM